MASIFDRLRGALGFLPRADGTKIRFRFPASAGIDTPRFQPIINDLGTLAAISPDLARDAILYVVTGAPKVVPALIAAKPEGFRTLLGDMGARPSAVARRAFLLNDTPCEPELIARYGEVLAAAHRSQPNNMPLFGPPEADLRLRLILGTALSAVTDGGPAAQAREPITGLTPPNLVLVATALSLPPEQVFDLLLWSGTSWTQRNLIAYLLRVQLAPFIRSHGAAILRHAQPMRSEGKADLLARLHDLGLCGEEPFVSFVVEAAGAPQKGLREAGFRAAAALPAAVVEPLALQRLQQGDKAMREGMAALLRALNTDTARAALRAHGPQDKPAPPDTPSGTDDATGYTALDGSRATLPAILWPPDDDSLVFGAELHRDLTQVAEAYNATATALNAELAAKNQRWGQMTPLPSPDLFATATLALFNTGRMPAGANLPISPVALLMGHAPALLDRTLRRLPLARAIRLKLGNAGAL